MGACFSEDCFAPNIETSQPRMLKPPPHRRHLGLYADSIRSVPIGSGVMVNGTRRVYRHPSVEGLSTAYY